MQDLREVELLPTNTLKFLAELYRQDPVEHAYVIYDLLWYPDRTLVLIDLQERAYILLFRFVSMAGTEYHVVHIFGRPRPQLLDALVKDYLRTVKSIVVTVSEDYAQEVVSRVSTLGEVSIGYWYTLTCNSSTFIPHERYPVQRLGDEHVDQILEMLRDFTGREPKRELVLKSLRRDLWYGVVIDGNVLSIACVYLRLPEVWIVGNVYTRPEWRGRGLAKSVLSKVIRDALNVNAIVALHVDSTNPYFDFAMRAYQKVGFIVKSRKVIIKVSSRS